MKIKIKNIIFRKDLYPRIEHDISTIQKYAENLDCMPPIEINQDYILIDGYHRWTAYKKLEIEEIEVIVIQTKSDNEILALSIEKNAKHGLQLNDKDKKSMAIRLYNSGTGIDKKEIARILSVKKNTVDKYLVDIEKQLREERKNKIFDMYLKCYTNKEISDTLKVTENVVKNELETFKDCILKSLEVDIFYKNSDFVTPLYNIWSYARCSNSINHFGKTEQNILDNLLYLYTEPFDIVLDPFAGGGSTIDVCKKRLRRYYVSDRKPIVERENEIRKLDIVEELPMLNKRWSEVTLTYLDPPYWKQAENQYSKDKEDLANQNLEDFTKNICFVINNIAKKQSKGVIALIIQPTQWKSNNKEFTDHVFQIIKGITSKKLILENRVSCPYSTQQCTPQMVNWAKENKKLLVLSRELIIWRLKNEC